MKFIKPSPKSVLSLDVGRKRIGLAYCDALFITVSILPAVSRSIDLKEIETYKRHIHNLNITGIIIGLPLDENGNMTNQAKDCIGYGEIINNTLKLPFNYVNEHSSTWESINTHGIKKVAKEKKLINKPWENIIGKMNPQGNAYPSPMPIKF